MKKKLYQEAPLAELIEVRFEENILSGFSENQKTEYFNIEEEESI